jgi:hypothetical protein
MSAAVAANPNYERIIALQGLSTFYVPEASAAPGAAYGWVTYRTLGRFLDRDAGLLAGLLGRLAEFGFCEVTPVVARLSPERWAANTSRYSGYLAYFVSNAPCSLRGDTSLRPVDPRLCFNPQPQRPTGKSACETTNFNGVYDATKYRALCEVPEAAPLELLPIFHITSLPDKSLADNLNFLVTPCSKFRSFLAALYLQSMQVPSLSGIVSTPLADYVGTTPFVVFAPCDKLDLALLSPSACQLLAVNFVAPLTVAPACFASFDAYPLSFTTLAGGCMTLNASGEAHLLGAGACYLGSFVYTFVGPALGGGALVALTDLLPPGTVVACNPPLAGEACGRTLVDCGLPCAALEDAAADWSA